MITRIQTGRLTEKELDRIIRRAAEISDAGQRITALSEHFLGIAYRESTLRGDMRSPEELVVNLEGADCFTFLDYVEAMRLAGSFAGFLSCLRRIRYRGGILSFRTRNHFFTDWAVHNASFVRDVTAEVGEGRALNVRKSLNRKEDGSLFLEGVEPVQRMITYLPADAFDERAAARLRPGDYAGIYSEREGLDVSHVGIIVRTRGVLMLRHASSDAGAVIDQEAVGYLTTRPGLVILRPVNPASSPSE